MMASSSLSNTGGSGGKSGALNIDLIINLKCNWTCVPVERRNDNIEEARQILKKGEILATPVDAEEVIETVGGEDHLMSDDSLHHRQKLYLKTNAYL